MHLRYCNPFMRSSLFNVISQLFICRELKPGSNLLVPLGHHAPRRVRKGAVFPLPHKDCNCSGSFHLASLMYLCKGQEQSGPKWIFDCIIKPNLLTYSPITQHRTCRDLVIFMWFPDGLNSWNEVEIFWCKNNRFVLKGISLMWGYNRAMLSPYLDLTQGVLKCFLFKWIPLILSGQTTVVSWDVYQRFKNCSFLLACIESMGSSESGLPVIKYILLVYCCIFHCLNDLIV